MLAASAKRAAYREFVSNLHVPLPVRGRLWQASAAQIGEKAGARSPYAFIGYQYEFPN
jgi:hypothetical protein